MNWPAPKSMYESAADLRSCPRAMSPVRNSGACRRFEIDRHSTDHLPPRRVERSLRIHAVRQKTHERLHVARRLDRAAHDAERRKRRAILREESGNDRVERPLAAPDLVRVAALEREPDTAILQADAGTRNDDARAESHVVRLDQRHHHPGCVGGAQVNGAAVRRLARAEILRALRIDQAGARREIIGIEHRRGGDAPLSADR